MAWAQSPMLSNASRLICPLRQEKAQRASMGSVVWRELALALALVLVLCGWVGMPAHAAAEPVPVPSAATPDQGAPAEAVQPLIEKAREQTRTLSERLARNVDSWFGDEGAADPGARVTDGQLSLGIFHRRDRDSEVDVRFTARFRLPNFEKSAYLFIGRDDPRTAVQDTPESNASSGKQQLLTSRPDERSFLGGLGGALGEQFNFRVGVSAHLEPFVQLRYDRTWAVSPDQVVGFRETVFWSRGDRFGSTTALTYEFALQPQLALRWIGAATITQETRNVEWSSNLGLYRAFGSQKLLSLELLSDGTGTQGNGVGLSDRGILAKWEQPLYRDWLLGEVAVGHFWLRPDSQSPRGRAWALGGTLKMRF